jgi:branched-chain amino acid transport system ATP-binding protein
VTALVELAGVSKSFGALKVIDGLDVRLDDGEALGVVGPNGAGKTTMLHLIAGQLRPDAGTVAFGGRDVTGLPARARTRLGIARTYQIPQPFGGLTVFENVLVGATFGRPDGSLRRAGGSPGPTASIRQAGRSKRGRAHDAEDPVGVAVGALEQAGLLQRANTLAGVLPLLDRKRLELARALATRPRVLLLDEIAGGLVEHEMRALITTVNQLRAAGISIIWIEHIVHALVSVVDRLLAIDFGRKLAEGAPQAVIASPQVRDVYLGAEAG